MTDALPSSDALTYRFHQFRPSDREELRRVAALPTGDAIFVAALTRYLDGWANGTWLQEYDIEVIAEWCTHHLAPLVPVLVDLAEQKRSGPGQSAQVYGVFLAVLLGETPTALSHAVGVDTSDSKHLTA